MPFATSNLRPANTVKVLAGDWSGSAGDASGTITLSGGRVYLAQFVNQDADAQKEQPLINVSIASGVITLTVHNHMEVTDGRFVVIYA